MARAVTEKFEELVLEIETATPGSYVKVVGLVDVTISRKANVDQAEIPDEDESLPLAVERQVRSIDVTVSGTGVFAQQSHGDLADWFYSSATKNVRIRNTKAAVGDTEIEAGPALLTTFDHGRTKGQKVSCSIEIQFDGQPARTPKAA